METHSGAPFWLVRNGLGPLLPALHDDVRCDVVILGGGITGALLADALVREGVDVVVIDQRDPGIGSTAASTALLLYETDLDLGPLAERVGERDAARVFALGRDAISEIGRLAADLGGTADFLPVSSLYLASTRRHARALRSEAALRRRLGFDSAYLSADELERSLGYRARGAIVSTGAGRLDPLRLARQLLHRAQRSGARVYARTTATAYDVTATGVRLTTDHGHVITAHRVIFAIGYELPDLFPRNLTQLHSTFALVTARADHVPASLEGHVVWETARPYAYLRATPDGRLMIGGCDVPYKNAALRDRVLPGRVTMLERRLRALHPEDVRATEFTWSGTFAETKDTLPYIGTLPAYPRGYFALGYGGNGITFSVIAARIICDLYRGRANADAAIFRLDR